ncbi:hypothetical protein GCM10027275_00540 [Rhabdobacter roseus]|uniref:VCBS repeat-containing protein n=1 Tax=Rhabdobacter roseus TaxID=1655419 RepID=A0A840TPJ0_9BACT|nr:VCBS repeat-containing protein [Rhabdobacter roseus]MBB5281938.1 hypothetical protein [Rhabdobacter roseus]
MQKIVIGLVLWLALFGKKDALGQTGTPESGKPLKSTLPYDRFALPSVNGFLLGMARANADKYPDLFISSDRYNPGTYYHAFEKYSPEGVPVFSEPKKIAVPFEQEAYGRSVLLENSRGEAYGFWAVGQALHYGKFQKSTLDFSAPKPIAIHGLPRGFGRFGVIELAPSRYLFLFTVADSAYQEHPDPAVRHARRAYGPEGFWQNPLPKSGMYGAFVSSLDSPVLNVKPLTSLDQTYFSLEGYTLYTFRGQKYLLCGTTLGNLHAYRIDEHTETLGEATYLVNPRGLMHRNPAIHGYLAFFDGPGAKGLIVSSEGGIYFYKAEDKQLSNGALVFAEPVHLLQTHPDLYGSSLVVPTLTDWDGDGDLDIISGTSLGLIYFFENRGNDAHPKFHSPVAVEAGGYAIHIQPGYNQSVQGPVESRWGYSCPTVYDWNGDGLPDLLTGDSRGKFNIYVNTGTREKPYLQPERPLYVDGLDLHGTWRVQPGVGQLGDRNAYICLDTDDEFHLYWQLDTYNLQDGGKLTIGDSIPIRANWKKGGETGRSKIVLVDWDQDGVKDLLVGTPRYATIPEPTRGLPYRLPENGAAVLFLRNAGTEARPVYEYPVAVQFKNERINKGQHACSPTVGYLGPGNSLNLLVGDETGRFYFYQREDLQWTK